MHTLKRIGEGILSGGIVFLLFIVSFAQLLHLPGWLKVTGRMHPMFLHFPIVLLILSFLSLWITVKEPGFLKWLDAFRLLAALSAVITAIMGLLLSLEEDRSGSALQWHKWTGISVAVLAALLYAFHNFFEKHLVAGRALTILAGCVIILAGHWGATLTHGADYLLAPLSVDRKVPLAQAIVYKDVIRPIFETKCFSCHGEDNVKGGLMLDNIDGIKYGGKTGPLYVAGNPAISLLIHRIHLPDNDKKHMPPKSKSQLTEDEAALLYAWIRSGAVLDKKLTTIPVLDSFRVLASHYLGSSEVSDQPVYTFAAADAKKIASLNNNFRVLEQPGEGSPAISVHFYGKDMYSAKALEELLGIKQQIIELSLARMPVKDNELELIKQMPNLRSLNLNYTDITAKGIEQLTGLKNLQELALSGTAVTTASLEKIVSLPQLKAVYAWNTAVDSVQLAGIRKRYQRVAIETGFVDDGLVTNALSSPIIKTPAGIFDKSVTVELKHPFRGVDIRYTTDGTVPDSVSGTRYKAPITIDTSTTIIARAFKPGWIGSNSARADYLKRNFKPEYIELTSLPDQNFRTGEGAVLSDGDLAELNHGNGGWLGYRANDAGYVLYFQEPVKAQSVLLNMLRNTGSYVFPPTKVEVWGGMNKDDMKLLGTIKPEMPDKPMPTVMLKEIVAFEPSLVKVIKIQVSRLMKLPLWHAGKGEAAWVFVSEIVVN